MKIQMCYDPVKPETSVSIDGKEVEKTDIHGFLYPVRRYILQTWLYPNGSWPGISAQMSSLARGEKIELEFCGRKCDYEDLKEALIYDEYIVITFKEREVDTAYEQLLEKIEDEIRYIIRDDVSVEMKNMQQLYPDEKEKIDLLLFKKTGEWICKISSDDDLEKAKKMWGCCCEIDENYLDSYEKFYIFDDLISSLCRSEDMILCPVSDLAYLENLRKCSELYNFSNICLYDKEDKTVYNKAKMKYGNNYYLREKIRNYYNILKIIESLISRITILTKQKKKYEGERDPESIQIRRKLESEINWLWVSKIHINKIKKLLEEEV